MPSNGQHRVSTKNKNEQPETASMFLVIPLAPSQGSMQRLDDETGQHQRERQCWPDRRWQSVCMPSSPSDVSTVHGNFTSGATMVRPSSTQSLQRLGPQRRTGFERSCVQRCSHAFPRFFQMLQRPKISLCFVPWVA